MVAFTKTLKRLLMFTAAFILPVFFSAVMAQQNKHIQEGVIRIKVTEVLAAQLENRTFSKSLTGELITGIQSIDQVNKKLKVKRFVRVFPDGGKFEAKHRRYGLHLWYEVNMDKGSSISQAIQSYKDNNQVVKAEPVYVKSINGPGQGNFGPFRKEAPVENASLPSGSNDPLFKDQWHYNNTGQTGGTAAADIRLLQAWKLETGKRDVIVAITDEGIQANHPDLAANMWVNTNEIANNNIDDDQNGYVDDIHGYSFVEDTGDITPGDHGSHAAGTIAAVNNNGTGVAGVAGGSGSGDGVRLMSCAVFTDWQSGGFAASYVYAADNGAVISQNSWGYTYPDVYEESVLAGIDYFIDEAGKDENGNQTGLMNGGIVIFAAGNSGEEARYFPGYYEPVFAVAATTHNDQIAYYSNYGPWVDISAPGGETNGSQNEGVLSTLSGDGYGFYMGTSMACPHVSGVAALIISKYGKPGFTPDMLKQRMQQTADNIDAINTDYEGKLGAGRINAHRGVASTDTTPPSAITTLAIQSMATGQITLRWTAPADAGSFVAAYDIRYSTAHITTSNFNSATPLTNPPAPQQPGSVETATATGLVGGRRYYFAVKSIDFDGNASALSNIVNRVAAATPVIAFSPPSLTARLKTAETTTRTFTISNTGQAPLQFNLEAEAENAFAYYTPRQGTAAPGTSQIITLSFDAHNLLSGTYHQPITIRSNDPERQTVLYPLTLNVTNNNAPIVSLEPDTISFKSVQLGSLSNRTVAIHNAGSNTLTISQVVSDNNNFTTDFSASLTVAPFKSKTLTVTFRPQTTGMFTGRISVHSNDPVNPISRVHVNGEGLNVAPLEITPDQITLDVPQGTTASRTLTLRNNGSFEQEISLKTINNHPVSAPAVSAMAEPATASTRKKFLARRQEIIASMKTNAAAVDPMLRAIPVNTAAIKTSSYPNSEFKYITDFEEFNLGTVDAQHDWSAGPGWTIQNTNAFSGQQHLQGKSSGSGMDSYVFAPSLKFDAWSEEGSPSRYTYASMKINLDNNNGETWELIPQEPEQANFLVTRIRFTADGRMEALSIDEEYEFHWHEVDVELPSGYFDFAIEHDSWGDDYSGFPKFTIYINNHAVFDGRSLGIAIGQVIWYSVNVTEGSSILIDDLVNAANEFVPEWLTLSKTDFTIAPGATTTVDMNVDATTMRYGIYSSAIEATVNDTEKLTIPATLTVSGEPGFTVTEALWINVAPDTITQHDIIIENTGGTSLPFALHTAMPGWTFSPASGTIPIRGTQIVTATLDSKYLAPGFYKDPIKLQITTSGNHSITDINMNVTVWETRGEFYVDPGPIVKEMLQGELATITIPLHNKGQGSISFESYSYREGFVTPFPASGKISDDPVNYILTLDGSQYQAQPEEYTVETSITLHTNDPDHSYTNLSLQVTIKPNPHIGKVIREEWKDVSGKTVASIPVASPPTSVEELRIFEAASDKGDFYGARVRGYLHAPVTQHYTFWIASDDNSELWLSTDESAENRVKIASVTGYTASREWTKYATQQSAQIHLEGGKKYYIEALHKEASGRDHLAVGWGIESWGFIERPIEGYRLFPFGPGENLAPVVSITSPENGQVFSAPASFEVKAAATDPEQRIAKVEFFNGTVKAGEDATAPYSYSFAGLPSGTYNIFAVAIDNYARTDTASLTITVIASQCAGTGTIQREVWTGISGKLISSIPVNSPPSSVNDLTLFESPVNTADNFGSRIRGYICAPQSGSYTFSIASDDYSELWLSTNDDPSGKVKIASVTGFTSRRQWDKYASQRSVVINLQAGQKYFIEALHKEATGADHLAVGWQLPDGTFEGPIAGNRLMPYETENTIPLVSITSPEEGSSFNSPASITIIADATDSDGSISKVEFLANGSEIAEDNIAPYTFTWNNVPAGQYQLTVRATDNSGGVGTANVNVTVPEQCAAKNLIRRAYWANVTGTTISSIPVDQTPTSVIDLNIFESPSATGDNYGARIRGYVCVPQSGPYTFWIASDDNGELWLSTNDQPENKIKIASVTGHTSKRQWEKYVTQRSAAINLVAGYKYYIEALHKEITGGDHLAVGWQLPDGMFERPIPGNRLIPFEINSGMIQARQTAHADVPSDEILSASETKEIFTLHPNPLKDEKVILRISGDEDAREMQVRIVSITGVTVYSENILCDADGSSTIDVDNRLAAGVYMVYVVVNRKRFARRLVVR